MDLHDIGVYNTPETGANEVFETIQEEVEWEDEEYEEDARVIVPPEQEQERRNLDSELEGEQDEDPEETTDADDPQVLNDVDQDMVSLEDWTGAFTPESILGRRQSTRGLFRESTRRQSFSLRGTGSRVLPPRVGTPAPSRLQSLIGMQRRTGRTSLPTGEPDVKDKPEVKVNPKTNTRRKKREAKEPKEAPRVTQKSPSSTTQSV